jgi:hypothetical protein
MERVHELSVPLEVDIGIAYTWADAWRPAVQDVEITQFL